LTKSLIGKAIWEFLEKENDLQIPSGTINEKKMKFDIIWLEAMEKIIEKVEKTQRGKFTNKAIQKEMAKQLKELLNPQGEIGKSIIGQTIYEMVNCKNYLLGKPISTSEGLRPMRKEDVKDWLE